MHALWTKMGHGRCQEMARFYVAPTNMHACKYHTWSFLPRTVPLISVTLTILLLIIKTESPTLEVKILLDMVDLTLPETVPEAARYHSGSSLAPIAVYSLCGLSDNDLEDLRATCESQCEDEPQSNVRLPPRSRFTGQPLRRIIEYHLQLGDSDDFDPRYFIVATNKDWKNNGVLLVTLDDDDLECHPDKFFCRAEDSGLYLINLQIANMDWDEIKESGMDAPANDSDDGDNGDDDDAQDRDEPRQGQGPETVKEAGDIKDDGFSDGAPAVPPPVGFFIAVYVAKGINAATLIQDLEPAAHIKTPQEFVCWLEADNLGGSRASTESTIVREACQLHPLRCKQNPLLHKELLLVATSQDVQHDGVVLAKVDWPGSAGDSNAPRESLGGGFHYKWQRVAADYNGGAPGNAVGDACLIAQGYRKWSYSHLIFIVHTIEYPDSDIVIQTAIDKRWDRRGHGQERVLIGSPNLPEPRVKDTAAVLVSSDEAAVRPLKAGEPQPPNQVTNQFPTEVEFYKAIIRDQISVCHDGRFRNNLIRQYCVVVDQKPTLNSADGPVLLIHLLWNGDEIIRQKDEKDTFVENLVNDWKTVLSVLRHQQASKAYEYLSDVVNGKKVWEGVRCGDFLA